MLKKIFEYGVIEYYNITKEWHTTELGGITHLTFKILLANIDEIYTFLHDIKSECWKMECWLVRYKHQPKILFALSDQQEQVYVEEDWFWQMEYELLTDFSKASL